MKKLLAVVVMGLALSSVPVSAFATDVKGTWLTQDPNQGLAKVIKEEPTKAWIVTPDGKKQNVKPIDRLNNNGGGTYSMWYDSSGFQYYYDHYESNYHDFDNFHFWVGSVTYRNESGNMTSMSYSQQNSKTNTWTTTGKVSVEAGLGFDLIASAKATFGIEVASSVTTSASTTITGTANVSPHSQGTLSCYDAGAYSGGAGAWKKYSPAGSLMGMYYESTAAWTVATNYKSFKYTEYGI